jgi:hypothetical protein
MKIPFNKRLATAQNTVLPDGCYVGTILQIANIGMQPGYSPADPPTHMIAVVIQLPGLQVAKKMRLSDSPKSALFAYLDATLPDPETYDGDDPLPLTLGRPISVEIKVNGQFTNVTSIRRPEAFELASAPAVAQMDCLILDDPELTSDAAKGIFLKLHRDIRGWLSKRIRG